MSDEQRLSEVEALESKALDDTLASLRQTASKVPDDWREFVEFGLFNAFIQGASLATSVAATRMSRLQIETAERREGVVCAGH